MPVQIAPTLALKTSLARSTVMTALTNVNSAVTMRTGSCWTRLPRAASLGTGTAVISDDLGADRLRDLVHLRHRVALVDRAAREFGAHVHEDQHILRTHGADLVLVVEEAEGRHRLACFLDRDDGAHRILLRLGYGRWRSGRWLALHRRVDPRLEVLRTRVAAAVDLPRCEHTVLGHPPSVRETEGFECFRSDDVPGVQHRG